MNRKEKGREMSVKRNIIHFINAQSVARYGSSFIPIRGKR
jgi:hypothetical protein